MLSKQQTKQISREFGHGSNQPTKANQGKKENKRNIGGLRE